MRTGNKFSNNNNNVNVRICFYVAQVKRNFFHLIFRSFQLKQKIKKANSYSNVETQINIIKLQVEKNNNNKQTPQNI